MQASVLSRRLHSSLGLPVRINDITERLVLSRILTTSDKELDPTLWLGKAIQVTLLQQDNQEQVP